MKNEQPPINAKVWDSIEENYRANLYHGTGQDGDIKRIEGKRPVLLSAPHALNHFRDGAEKLADRWTGSLAEMLAWQLAASSIIPTGPIPDWRDWKTRADQFKTVLDEFAAVPVDVIDLHGMSAKYGIDICIGLGPEPSESIQELSHRLYATLSRHYRVEINDPFSAEPDYTVTSYVQKFTPSNGLQIEISSAYRNPRDAPIVSEDFLATFCDSLASALPAPQD